MAHEPHNHQYGTTNVDGQASLHQGDVNNNHVNHVYIGNVALALPVELVHLSGVVAQIDQAKTPARSNIRKGNPSMTHGLTKKISAAKFRKSHRSSSLKNPKDGEVQKAPELIAHKLAIQSHVDNPHGKARIVSLAPNKTGGNLIASSELRNGRAGQEFLVLCALILSFAIGRQVTTTQVLHFLHHCRQDELFPALTFILGVGLYRYATSGALVTQPTGRSYMALTASRDGTGFSGLEIGVSLAFVKRLLNADRRQSDRSLEALSFVQEGFHLVLGSRQDFVTRIHKDNPQRQLNAFELGQNAIKALACRGEQNYCASCTALFQASIATELYCPWCQSFHPDYESVIPKLASGEDLGLGDQYSSHRKHVKRSRALQPRVIDTNHYADCRIILDGLTNLRIKIDSVMEHNNLSTTQTWNTPLRARAAYAYYGSHANIFHLHAQDVVVVHQRSEGELDGLICIFDNKHFTILQDDDVAVLKAISDRS